MPNTNLGPASTVTPNATGSLSGAQGSQTGPLFAALPTTGFNLGETVYTSDRGLCYWNGTAWVGIASLAGTAALGPVGSLPAGTIVGQIASTTDAGVVFWNGTTWQALDGSRDSLRLLAQGKALNVNQTGDIGLLPVINSTRWTVHSVIGSNMTVNAGTSVAIAICSATAGAPTTIVAPQILSGLVAFGGATVDYRFTVQNVSFAGTGQTIFVNCQTTAGTTCTLDVSVYGWDLT